MKMLSSIQASKRWPKRSLFFNAPSLPPQKKLLLQISWFGLTEKRQVELGGGGELTCSQKNFVFLENSAWGKTPHIHYEARLGRPSLQLCFVFFLHFPAAYQALMVCLTLFCRRMLVYGVFVLSFWDSMSPWAASHSEILLVWGRTTTGPQSNKWYRHTTESLNFFFLFPFIDCFLTIVFNPQSS